MTDRLVLGHLDLESVLEILRHPSQPSPERLQFFWKLLEGVPKFCRDGFEQGVRDAERAAADTERLEGHVDRFLRAQPRFVGWRIETVSITVRHTDATRRQVERRGCIAEDLLDLTRGL